VTDISSNSLRKQTILHSKIWERYTYKLQVVFFFQFLQIKGANM